MEISKPFQGADNTVLFLPIEKVKPNPYQPRKNFDEKTLEELSISIKKHGILQPLLVEKVTDDEYRIIAGERRYRASCLADIKTIPVIVKEFSNLDRMEIAVTENVQRENLNPLEEAMAYYYLISEGGLSQEEVAERIGKSRSAIANSIRLLYLPQPMQDAILEGKITSGHARALLQVKAPSDRETLFDMIVSEGMSVRTAENLANDFNNGGRLFRKNNDAAVQTKQSNDESNEEVSHSDEAPCSLYDRDIIITIQDKFIKLLGTNVRLSGTFNKGKLILSYNSYSALEKIFEKAGGNLPLVEDEE